MKKTIYYLGYFTALAAALTVLWKVNHLPYVYTFVLISCVLLSVYFTIYIIDKMRDSSTGKTPAPYIIAGVCAAFVTLSILFKLEHWPLASTFLAIGIGGFSLVFIPMLYFLKSKEPGVNNLMNIAGAAGLSLAGLGLLFKIQHWPAAQVLMIAGIAFLFLIYFPMYMMNKAVADDKKTENLREAYFAIIIGSMLILLVITMVQKQVPPAVAVP